MAELRAVDAVGGDVGSDALRHGDAQRIGEQDAGEEGDLLQPVRGEEAEGAFVMGAVMRFLFARIAALDPAETIAGADEDAVTEEGILGAARG